AIQKLLPGSRLYTGMAASGSAMRALRSPLVLHIATHGFSAATNTEAPSEAGDTMFNAGLVFAGANAVLRGREIDPLMGAAILTGEEAATLHLAGTELVVLSACRSGLGQPVRGEGVFGLHRAFASAGARSVVVSLWKIPDAETKDLMVDFYRELRQGRQRASALREAKRRMRKKHSHPFFWGSFLCHGDWRPVPGITQVREP
ncbi:MAG TPA: CHAT domain-containing protein, partial [Thermoanaerobaculia bacterium]|nr:CHAT domain-containing protein [Thermoanaerobaculia bacterium]